MADAPARTICAEIAAYALWVNAEGKPAVAFTGIMVSTSPHALFLPLATAEIYAKTKIKH